MTFEDVCAAEPSAAALAQCAAPDRLAALQLDPSIGAVVVGWDPGFDYARLCYASACLRELPGCLFVGTNLDAADRMGGSWVPGREAGAGARGGRGSRKVPWKPKRGRQQHPFRRPAPWCLQAQAA